MARPSREHLGGDIGGDKASHRGPERGRDETWEVPEVRSMLAVEGQEEAS